MRVRTLSTTLAALALAAVGCSDQSSSPDVLSYDEFKAQAHHDPETNTFVINGDELVETEEQLREVYEAYLDTMARVTDPGYATTEQGLAVNRVNGVDDKWSATTAQNLTYCISQSSFGSRYNTVVNAMNAAASAWEGSGRVNFVHVTSRDSACTRSTTGVVFNIRQVSGGSYLARAFFPSTSRSGREILIDTTSFGNISPYTLTGILRHELGHTLGFRHEHTRPEAGTCFENTAWRALTTYDSASVMHYPQCNGTNFGDLVLTTRDRQGTAVLYP